MPTAVTTAAKPDNPALSGILLGGFFAGLADFLFATTKTMLAGNSPLRPWKGVASGLLGQAARDGGAGMAVLYGIAFLAIMNYVILPLPAIGVSIYKPATLPVNAFWHIVLVGLPTAWFVTRGLRGRPH